MKNEKLRKIARRGMSLLLSALMVAPLGLFAPEAKASVATPGSTTTKLVVWDWIDNIQALGKEVDYDISNETSYVPVEETKYSRIMFYQNTMGDRYYFNADPGGGGMSGSEYSTYESNCVYSDALSRVGDSSHKEWNEDMVTAETAAEAAGVTVEYGGVYQKDDPSVAVAQRLTDSDKWYLNRDARTKQNQEEPKSFITVGGERTPYIQWVQSADMAEYHDYNTWRLWAANKDDTCSEYAVCLEDSYEYLNVRRTKGFNNPVSQDVNGSQMNIEPWVIDWHSRSRASADYECSHDNFVIWHYDPDTGGYNETMNFDDSGRRFKVKNTGTKAGVEEFKIFLGKEYKVPTLNENFEVHDDQITTLGRPLYYIPKGYSITVRKDGVLTVDGVLFNDGTIKVEDGGLLIVKDGAKIMPLTKYDKSCGSIISEGSIVVEENALLCGGALNGVVIKRGGVINFGIIATENLIINTSYAVDNRETGYVIAGRSPSRAARIRMIKDAIANEGETEPMNKDTDFAKLVGSDGGTSTQIRDNSIFNHTENVIIDNTKLLGSASNPTLSVYTRATPNDTQTPLFEDVDLDNVSLRMDGDTAVYTVTNKGKTEEHRIRNKLVSALIARGETQKEKLFENMWVGSLDGAYVQIEPACAPGKRLALSNGNATEGNTAIIWTANSDKDKWWQIKSAGTVRLSPAYYIDSVKSADKELCLDIPGMYKEPTAVKRLPNGESVMLGTHSSVYNDMKWFLTQDAGNAFSIRNAADPDFSLNVVGAGTADGTGVQIYKTNDSNEQRWTLSLLNDESYSNAVDLGTAVEVIPGSAPTMRMGVPLGAQGHQAMIRESSPTDFAQRWRFEPVGTDMLNGVSTTFYRVVELNTGLALCVDGTALTKDTAVYARTPENDGTQYWYLFDVQGSDRYYIATRGNSSFVLTAPTFETRSAGNLTVNVNTGSVYQQWQISGLAGSVTTLTREEVADPLDGKTFTLEPKHAPGMAAGGRIMELQTPNDSFDQQWTFTKAGVAELDGAETPYYTLEHMESGYLMAGSQRSWEQVRQRVRTADDTTQQWFAVKDADGYYTFVPRSNTEICLDVRSAGTTAGSRVQVYTRNGSDAQKWKLTEITGADRFDGRVFTLSPTSASDYNIDLVGNGKTAGTYAQLYVKEETEVQRWRFVKQGEAYLNGKKHNYYTIESVYAAGMALGIPDHAANGARAHLQAKDPANQSQLWFAEPSSISGFSVIPKIDTTKYLAAASSGNNAQVTLADAESSYGGYRSWFISETVAPEKIFTNVWLESVGASGNDIDLQSYSNNQSPLVLNQANADGGSHWTFEKMGVDSHGTYYRIWNHRFTDRVLEVGGSGQNVKEGAATMTSTWEHGASDQLWYLDKAGTDDLGDYYYIASVQNSTFHLAVNASNKAIVTSSNTGDTAKWRLNELFEAVTVGTYEFGSAAAVGMRMEAGNSTEAGGDVKLYHRSDRSAVYNVQKWKIILRGYDLQGGNKVPYYSIENVNSGKTIDVNAEQTGAVKQNAGLKTNYYSGYSDQLWYIDAQTDGTVIFRSRGNTDLVLEASGTTDNSSLRLAALAKKESPAQLWQLHPVMQQNDAGQYYIPGSRAAVEAGIPNATSVNIVLDPEALGRYVLTPKHSATMRLTLKGGDNSNGAAVVASMNDGTASQRWIVTPVGVDFFDGRGRIYYKLTYADSAAAGSEGRVVETSGFGPAAKDVNVDISDYAGSYDQLWYLEQAVTAADDVPAYYLIGRGTFSGTKICLEVSGGATQNNTSIQTRIMASGKNYQLWTLEPFV